MTPPPFAAPPTALNANILAATTALLDFAVVRIDPVKAAAFTVAIELTDAEGDASLYAALVDLIEPLNANFPIVTP